MTEKSLIHKIKDNGESEIEAIYRNYRGEFRSWALRNFNCTDEDIQDIYQQVIIILYENVLSGKLTHLNSQIKTYLFAIGKNKFYELMRAQKKHDTIPDFEISDRPDDLMREYEEKEELLQMVEQSLSQLGDPCKRILEKFYYHQKSNHEIAGEMDYKNSDTVKNLKYKCLQRLKKIFLENNNQMEGGLS